MKYPPRTVVSRALHNHLGDTLQTAQRVQTVINSLMKHCHTDRSRRYTRGMLIGMARIIKSLDSDALDRAAMNVHNNRSTIVDSLGCNVYGRLDGIIIILDKNEPDRDEQVRTELLALLKFFPAGSEA